MSGQLQTCQVKMHGDKPCGRPLYDGDKCICHSDDPEKDRELFEREIANALTNEERHDFTQFVFPYGLDFTGTHFARNTWFMNVHFLGAVEFSDARFEQDVIFFNARFCGEATFRSAVFVGDVRFQRAVFQGEADFSHAAFQGFADLSDVEAAGPTNFTFTQLAGGSDFSRAKLAAAGGLVTFAYARLAGNDSFEETQFGMVEFRGTYFRELTRFSETCFREEASFKEAYLLPDSRVVFDNDTQQQPMFQSDTDFRRIHFSRDAKIEFCRVSLEKCRFSETDVTRISFTAEQWPRQASKRPNLIPTFIQRIQPARRKIVAEEMEDPLDAALTAQLYRRLQANYIANYRYQEAGDFHIGEQEMMRKGSGGPCRSAAAWLYLVISRYGESFLRPLLLLAAVMVLMPALILWTGVCLEPDGMCSPEELTNYSFSWNPADFLLLELDYWTVFAHNLGWITFARSGIFGGSLDTGQQMLILTAGVLVIVLVTFFVLALRRQFRRKSF